MLRLAGVQAESLFDEALPVEVRELPEDLGRLDVLLADRRLLGPIERAWECWARDHGRPTIAMATFVRLMVIKARTGWGYESLVREVSDSLHLRRFCLIALSQRVPDESTVRKLVRRLGPDVIDEITRTVIEVAERERRFVARAVRCDSTVVEADIRYPSDAGLAVDSARMLAAEGRRVATIVGDGARRVRDRSRAAARRLRLIGRTVARRRGEAKTTVLRLTGETGELVRASIREARRLAAQARAAARGRGAHAKLAAARRLETLADRADKVAGQITKRLAGENITDRLVSLADPDARPIRKGKLGKPTEFGYVVQLAEVTEHTRRGARGLILPASSQIGARNESELLGATITEIDRLARRPRELAFDGGFEPPVTNRLIDRRAAVFIAGRQQPDAKRSRRRLARYRVGCEGRISHLKRQYGLGRSRLKGHPGTRTWVGWAILAYNLDTLAIRPH
jgi:transposase, IS5 family